MHEVEFDENMTILQCFWVVTKMAAPIILGLFVFIFITNINIYFIGGTDDAKLLAGVGMGNALINVFAFSVTQGLNGAIETFVSSSFGAGKYEECGIFLNRGKFICTVVLIPFFIIFAVSDLLLIALGQDPTVSTIARNYCCILIPGIWAQTMFDTTQKFLNAQFQIAITIYVQLVTLIIHLILCYLFVRVFDGREIGAAIATNITYILNMVSLEVYCNFSKTVKHTYQFLPDRRTVQNIGTYMA